jgi:hypothetical protein
LYIISTSVSAFGLESSGTLSWTPICYLTGDCSVISWFSRNCSVGDSWRRASSCEAEVVVSAWWSCKALWGICPAAVERYVYRKVYPMSKADYVVFSFTVSNSDGCSFPLVGTREVEHLCSPRRIIEDLMAEFTHLWQRSMPTF